jgi:hypothetical protein
MPDRARERRLLYAAAIGCGLASAALGYYGKAPRATGGFLLAWIAAFVPYAIAVRGVFKLGARLPFPIVLGVALLLRLLVFPAAPSDDVNRYLWEGKVQRHGVDPYRVPPADPRLAPLRDARWGGINHPELTAIYPPATQLVQRAAVAARLGPAGWKAAMGALDLLAILALGALLRARGLPPGRAVVYAWSPLAVFEVAGRGHHEPLLLLPLLGAALLLGRGGAAERARLLHARAWAGAAAGAAVMAKWTALPLLAAWAPLLGVSGLGAAGAAAALLAAPFAGAGAAMFESLARFHADFHFADSLNALASALLGARGARIACALALAGLALALAVRERDAARSARALLGATVLLSPTVHPWYVLWVLPWLALGRPWGWLALSATVPLYVFALEARAGPVAELREAAAWKALAYAPGFAIGLGEALKRNGRGRGA